MRLNAVSRDYVTGTHHASIFEVVKGYSFVVIDHLEQIVVVADDHDIPRAGRWRLIPQIEEREQQIVCLHIQRCREHGARKP